MKKGSKTSNKRKKARIARMEFCEITNKMLFFIKFHGQKVLLKRTAAEIVLDTKLLKILDNCDACCACYTAGNEHAVMAKKHIKKSKKSKENTNI